MRKGRAGAGLACCSSGQSQGCLSDSRVAGPDPLPVVMVDQPWRSAARSRPTGAPRACSGRARNAPARYRYAPVHAGPKQKRSRRRPLDPPSDARVVRTRIAVLVSARCASLVCCAEMLVPAITPRAMPVGREGDQVVATNESCARVVGSSARSRVVLRKMR